MDRRRTLADLVELRKADILDRWDGRIRQRSFGEHAPGDLVRDDIPGFLELLTQALRRAAEPAARAEPREMDGAIALHSRTHGQQRSRITSDLRVIEHDYRLLRDTIFDVIEEAGYAPTLEEHRILGDALGAAIGRAVEEFAAERTRAVESARQLAEEREVDLRALADSIPQLARLTDTDGALTWANARWYDYTGASFEESKGWGWTSYVHPDHVDEAVATVRDGLASGTGWEQTFPIRSRRREYRRFLSRGVPMRNRRGDIVRWLVTDTDVEDHLRAKEERARLFAIIPEAVCVLGFDGVLVRVNPAFVGTFGWPEAELIGRPFLDLVHPDDHSRTASALNELVSGGRASSHFDTRLRTRGGEYRTLSWVTSAAREDRLVYGAARDVTEEIERTEALRRAAEFRERFLGIVAHDLRTPLGVIMTGASLLLRLESMPDGALRIARRILSSADAMSRMIAELLDFTRARLGTGVDVHRAPADLAEVVKDVVEQVSIAHPTRVISLVLRGAFVGAWDPDRLARVAANLLKNALDYSPPDSVVEVSLLRNADGDVELRIHNENLMGPIPPEQISELFDPFRRGAETSAKRREGLGLGLFITREIVRAHGGTVDVSSDEGGTTVVVRLPFVSAAEAT